VFGSEEYSRELRIIFCVYELSFLVCAGSLKYSQLWIFCIRVLYYIGTYKTFIFNFINSETAVFVRKKSLDSIKNSKNEISEKIKYCLIYWSPDKHYAQYLNVSVSLEIM